MAREKEFVHFPACERQSISLSHWSCAFFRLSDHSLALFLCVCVCVCVCVFLARV